MPKKDLRPGHDAPRRGTYTEVGPRGGQHGEVTMPRRGATMPPTEKPNRHYVPKK